MAVKSHFEWVSVDAPESACYDLPAYEGELFGIEKHLVNGTYRCYDESGKCYVLEITDVAVYIEPVN